MTAFESKNLRIVFAGTPEFAAHFLQLLVDTEHDIVGVYTQPDRPAGRGKKLQQSPVKRLALENHLPVLQPANFREQSHRDELADLDADLMVVVAYGLILPQAVLDTPKLGCINVHASLLPRWRGAAPIQRAIEAGDTQTGVTIMQMNAGLDTGDMLCVETCDIDPCDNAASVHDKLVSVGKPALVRALDLIANGSAQPQKQNNDQACYAKKIEKIEGSIDWTLDAPVLDRKIRAFFPFPVAYSFFEDLRIRIQSASVLENHSHGIPGQITRLSPLGIDVQAGRGSIRIEQLQLPGKKAMPSADILRGYPELFTLGNAFTSEIQETPSGETR